MADGESLWQGPASLSITQSIDPSLDYVPSFMAQSPRWQTALQIAGSFGPGAIRAWHGTPHQFSEFSNEAIGSGQGAQTYGWGHYVAGAKPTAESYQRELAGHPQLMYNDPDIGIQSLSDHMKGLDWEKSLPGAQWSTEDLAKYNALSNLSRLQGSGSVDDAIGMLKKQGYDSAASWVEQNKNQFSLKQPGHLLEIHVKPEEHELLDWDATLENQHPDIQNKLAKMKNVDPYNSSPTGAEIYANVKTNEAERMKSSWGTDEGASKALHQAGIPGIKYLDAGSRNLPLGHPDATSNYVIFDPSNLEIRSRNGIPMTPVEGDPFK